MKHRHRICVTKHAIDRYLERAGGKDRQRACRLITQIAIGAERQPDGKWFSQGWTLIISPRGFVETIYRSGTVMNKSVMKKRVFWEN